jgi:hypothetical protein
LRDIDTLGGEAKALTFGNRQEVPQLSQFHGFFSAQLHTPHAVIDDTGVQKDNRVTTANDLRSERGAAGLNPMSGAHGSPGGGNGSYRYDRSDYTVINVVISFLKLSASTFSGRFLSICQAGRLILSEPAVPRRVVHCR